MYNFNSNGECLSHLSHIHGAHSYAAFYTLRITHVWPNDRAHLSIVQYAIMCTCICVKNTYMPCSTHVSGVDWFPVPSSFYSYECESVGATSYKKWPMLIMIQLSPLTRYFVRPKKPVHALNISQTTENTLFLGP